MAVQVMLNRRTSGSRCPLSCLRGHIIISDTVRTCEQAVSEEDAFHVYDMPQRLWKQIKLELYQERLFTYPTQAHDLPLIDVEQALEMFGNQSPLVLLNLIAVELLQSINTLA